MPLQTTHHRVRSGRLLVISTECASRPRMNGRARRISAGRLSRRMFDAAPRRCGSRADNAGIRAVDLLQDSDPTGKDADAHRVVAPVLLRDRAARRCRRPAPCRRSCRAKRAQCAARRLAQFGPNEPAQRHRFSALAQFAHLFANPLVIIILVANAIAASLGQRIDALIIVTIVVLSVSINLWQSYQSAQAAERLRASVTPTATAFRDARWQESPLRTESRDLSIQQSMLTGESLHADKHASAAANHADETGPDARHLVFLGTSVVSGTGAAVAIASFAS